MEHDSTQLTPEERRIFAEIERSVTSELDSSMHRRRWGSLSALQWIWTMTIVLGAAALVGGLWFGAVAVAFVGFVGVLLGVSHVITDGITMRTINRVRKTLHASRRRPPQE